MSICGMYYHLMDRPKELVAHEKFFTELFDSFDQLLFVKSNDFEKYLEEYAEFRDNLQEKHRYFYT